MDISTYWQTIKKQSKELTGVSKIDAGLFHSSGIGGVLEDYIKAVKGGDAKKIVKAAEKAHAKADKYLNTIHKKEVAQGRKALKPDQLKSAKIVGDALEKIVAQLHAVVQDPAIAGSFDGDGERDAASSNEPLDPKLEQEAEAFLKARIDLLPEARKVKALYEKLAKPVDNHLKLAQRGVDEAKSAKAGGKTFENRQGIDLARRAADEIGTILEQMETYARTKVEAGGTIFMKLRKDFPGKKDLPKWYVTGYQKKCYDEWKKVEAVLVEATDFIKAVKAKHAEAEALVDVAESHSMQGADPSKLVAKLRPMVAAAEKLRGNTGVEIDKLSSTAGMVAQLADMDPSQIDAKTKLGNIGNQADKVRKCVDRITTANKAAKTMRKQVEAIMARSDDSEVQEAGRAVLAKLDEQAETAKPLKSATEAAVKAIAAARMKVNDIAA